MAREYNPIKFKKEWFIKWGGKRLTALLIGLVIPTYLVIIGAFAFRIEMAFDLAKFVCGFTLAGIVAYITGRTVHNIKELKNGGGNK